MTTSGASIASRAAARSNATGPPCGAVEHEMTGDRDPQPVGIERRPASRPGAAASSGGQARRLEDRGIGQPRVAGRARDPAPVRVAAVGGRLDQARRDDRAGHGPCLGVVARPRSPRP